MLVWLAGQSCVCASPPFSVSEGLGIAARLNARLDDTRGQCDPAAMPVWQCSGVILKQAAVKKKSKAPRSTDDNGKSWEQGTTQVVYLRADLQAAWPSGQVGNGLILFAEQQTPGNKTRLRILCFPPTGSLADKACGPLDKLGGRDRARPMWKSGSYGVFSVEAWPKEVPEKLPIEAFFFQAGQLEAMAAAQYDQRELYKKTGMVLPIVALVSGQRGSSRFVYDPEQQGELGNCPQYIQSATWSGPQLKIRPTACGRTFPEWDSDLAYAELSREYGNGPRWKVRSSAGRDPMLRQFICLRVNYPDKTTWDIETFRPYVDGVKAREKNCNP
ncbi:DUF2599 domain-containing protein [Pseudomonas sp. NPDC090202]|uniref:DUF2599 domain-containing protein n=1 Tax=unclassified Pseudomonas TaxID=196821 RepID=UPI0037FFCA02